LTNLSPNPAQPEKNAPTFNSGKCSSLYSNLSAVSTTSHLQQERTTMSCLCIFDRRKTQVSGKQQLCFKTIASQPHHEMQTFHTVRGKMVRCPIFNSHAAQPERGEIAIRKTYSS